MPLRRADGRLHGPGVFDMKAGIGVAMLAVRALHALAAAPLPTHRDAVDDRRRNRQRHVARGDRRRGAAERRRAGARAVAAGRRREDEPEGRRGVRAGGARRVRARRRRSRQRRERDPRDRPPDSRDRSACRTCRAASASTSASSRAARARTSWRITRRRRSTSGCPTLADAARLDAALRGLRPQIPGTRLELTGGIERPPFERSPGVVRLYELAQDSGRGARPRARRGGHRRRVGREFHRRAGCSYIRWPRAEGRRRARAARARRRGGFTVAGGAAGVAADTSASLNIIRASGPAGRDKIDPWQTD